MEYSIYLALGVLSGLLSGLLGLGGGIVIVPALAVIFKHSALFQATNIMHIATGTSLAVVILTSLSSAIAYQRRQAIIWSVFWRILPGLCTGIFIGFRVTQHLSDQNLNQFFSIFLALIGIYLGLRSDMPTYSSQSKLKRAPQPLSSIFGVGIGLLSVMFGIGGGLLMVPFCLTLNLSIREAAGTSSLCGVCAAILGTLLLSQIQTGFVYPHTSGYIYWPAACGIALSSVCFAPIGTRLAFMLPVSKLQQLFAGVLLLCAWYI